MATLADSREGDHAPLRTLVIDDSPSDVRLTRELLKDVDQQSFAVVHAYSLREARELVSRLEFDLVLLGLALPECSGVETVRRARDLAPHAALVAVTGCPTVDLPAQAIQASAQEYLVKDELTPERLARAIDLAVARRDREAELVRLAREAELLHEVLAHETDGLVVTDLNGRVLFCNPGARTLLGCIEGEPLDLLLDRPPSSPQHTNEVTLAGMSIELHVGSFHWEGEPALVVSARVQEDKQDTRATPLCIEAVERHDDAVRPRAASTPERMVPTYRRIVRLSSGATEACELASADRRAARDFDSVATCLAAWWDSPARAWRPHMAVSLQALLIQRAEFRALASRAPSYELTHDELLSQLHLAHERLDEIRSWGATFALRDSVTASLAVLTVLQPRWMWLPALLMRTTRADQDAQRLVASLVGTCRALGCELIAEGCESDSDIERMQSLGVQLAVGPAFGGWAAVGPQNAAIGDRESRQERSELRDTRQA